MQKSVIDQLKRKQIAALLEQDKRVDGRGIEEQRKLVLEELYQRPLELYQRPTVLRAFF